MKSTIVSLALLIAGITFPIAAATGVRVPFSLPRGEGNTYLVTLVATHSDAPGRIVATFVRGEPFTVTAENGGRFEAVWDGLDDDHMPVPPGEYGIEGIYSPAKVWPVDGEFHAVTPRYVGGAGSFLPAPDTPNLQTVPVPFSGDPVSSPMVDVDAAPNGRVTIHYQYLENGLNCPLLDLDTPAGSAQVLRAFPSGGVGGGPVSCTDGETVWACSRDGTPDFVYRADGRPFGPDSAPARSGGRLVPGAVQDMAAVPGAAGKTVVWLAERGKIVRRFRPEWNAQVPEESRAEFVDQAVALDGETGETLASVPFFRPRAFAPAQSALFVLHEIPTPSHGDIRLRVSRLPLRDGLPVGDPVRVFDLPENFDSADLARDAEGNFYVADRNLNHAYRLSPDGEAQLRFGAQNQQMPGTWDPNSFHGPSRLAVRSDAQGRERLLVVEAYGPNRLSEWDTETGAFLRDFPAYQTFANSGWGVDPADPEHAYLPGQGGWLVRWRIDTATGRWTPDAVWPGLRSGRLAPNKLAVIRTHGHLYFASEENGTVYRLSDDGRSLHLSAAILREGDRFSFWSDEDGNGEIGDAEKRPCELPPGVLTYHGQKWTDSLAYLALGQGTGDGWRLAPARFDAHGNPVFERFERVLADPVFAARREGTAGALSGAHELAESFSSDWMQADESPDGRIWTQARGGRNFSANFGAQHKICRYDPDPSAPTGHRLVWRTGRTDIVHAGVRGELVGAMRLFHPRGGLLAVIDQSRSGVFLYTEDGLYVDTLFASERMRGEQGVYKQHGEFFVGTLYGNRDNGHMYYAGGKYTPFLYELEGWTLGGNPVRPLTTVPRTVRLRLADIADPPEFALALRGGAGAARVASVAPAFGGVTLDGGSLRGWETAEPIVFGEGPNGRRVEARVLYDPDHFYLRWHVRTGGKVDPPRLADPVRMFAHDQGADTLSFHFQGDPDAPVPGPAAGRPGDVRLVFGLFRNASGAIGPLGMAYYPAWNGPNARPAGFRTPVGETRFGHVARIPEARYGWAMDEDGEGFVLAAAIPRAVFPNMERPFSGDLRTRADFEANLGGHARLWWANSDGSASAETWDEPTEARLFPGAWAPLRLLPADGGLVPSEWSVLGPFGGPATKEWSYDPSPAQKPVVADYFDKTVFAPDARLGVPDFVAAYTGPETTGWWGEPEGGAVRWRTAPLAEVDSRVVVGPGAQLWYGAVVLRAERDMDAALELHSHPMTTARWFLAGTEITPPPSAWSDDPSSSAYRRLATVPARLHRGDNLLVFRAYCTGYPPFRLGARVLPKDPADVWRLRAMPHPSSSTTPQPHTETKP